MTLRTLPLLLLTVFAVTLNARESVRQQIEREQRETGLTLAAFENRLKTVNFSERLPELKEINVGSAGRPLQGAISRDGESIAFELASNRPSHWTLGLSHADGRGVRELPEVTSPSSICWSNDKSKLALSAVASGKTNGEIRVVRLDSTPTEAVAVGGSLTSQCWSPDDQRIVYGVEKSIRLYELHDKKTRELATGESPAWSPDGNWIAYYHDGAYYAIRPSGSDQKILFRKKGHGGGPWWSPDGSLLAYIYRGGKDENWIGFESRQLRVRRLADGSDDWVLNEPDISFSPEYQWIIPKRNNTP